MAKSLSEPGSAMVYTSTIKLNKLKSGPKNGNAYEKR